MRIIRKNLVFICCVLIIFPLFFCACKKDSPLLDRVVELRSDIFEAKCEYFPLIANYGYSENPYMADGVISKKNYFLEFKIVGRTYSNVETYVKFTCNEKEYKVNFELDPVTHSVKAKTPVDNFDYKTFNATIYYGSEKEELTFNSILPQNTISHEYALERLSKEQKALIDSFRDQNGDFMGEITARVIVKNGAPYWYIGISTPSQTKALLIDGLTAKTLAIREIF